MTHPITLFVVANHALFHEGLVRVLDHDQNLRQVGSATRSRSPLVGVALERR